MFPVLLHSCYTQKGDVEMAEFLKKLKVRLFLLSLAMAAGALLYSYFGAETIRTRITDAQMAKVDGRFMIATEYRPFVNEDAWYRFKFDSGSVQNEAVRLKNREVLLRKYGWRIPFLSRYENVLSIQEAR